MVNAEVTRTNDERVLIPWDGAGEQQELNTDDTDL
jgi:hypothetical protein